MACDQAADHLQDAQIQGTGSWTTCLLCRSHHQPRTILYSGKDLLVVPLVQDAIRRQGILCCCYLDMERSASSHTVGHFRYQLPETIKNICLTSHTINHHRLSRRLRLAVSTKDFMGQRNMVPNKCF